MKTSLWVILFGILSMSALAQEQQAVPDSNIEIKAGNIVSIAIGEDASASVVIGVTDVDSNEADVHLEIGDIFRAAFGES